MRRLDTTNLMSQLLLLLLLLLLLSPVTMKPAQICNSIAAASW